MIKVDGLTKFYGSTRAVDNISFEVPEGVVLGFLGPNGAGKTTTMKILTCYTPPTSGSASVAGFDVIKNSLEVRRIIGYMPETVPLYKDMTVRSYLRFVAEAKGVSPKRRIRESLDAVIAEVGLEKVVSRLVGNLSRGYQQRVGLGQALIGEPKALILDEPTVGLDPRQIIEIRNVIKAMAGKRTVILCSHILPEVSQVCSHVVIISAGKIVARGTTDELVSELEHDVTTIALVKGDPNAIERSLSSIKDIKSLKMTRQMDNTIGEFELRYSKGKDMREIISRQIFNSGGGLLEFKTHGLSLEDIFIRVVTAEEKEVPTHVA